MDLVVEGNHGKNSKRRVARILCLSSLAKFDYSLYFYFYERKQKTNKQKKNACMCYIATQLRLKKIADG